MAVDAFLKIDGITGDSVDDKHKDEIVVESWSWGASNTAHVAATGGAGAGRATFQDFTFTAATSKASPQLLLACASGKHIKSATLTVRKAGTDQQPVDFMKIGLSSILINFYKEHGAAGDMAPQDEVGITFVKIDFQVYEQSPTGGVTAPAINTATVDLSGG